MSEEQKPERAKVLMLYMGVLVDRSEKKKYDALVEITPERNDGTVLSPAETNTGRWYPVKGNKHIVSGSPGSIFEIEANPDRTDGKLLIYGGTARWKGRWKNEDQVIAWTMASRAAEQSIDANTKGRREAARNLAWERLDPFVSVYSRTAPNERALLLANIIRYITAGRTVTDLHEE